MRRSFMVHASLVMVHRFVAHVAQPTILRILDSAFRALGSRKTIKAALAYVCSTNMSQSGGKNWQTRHEYLRARVRALR